MKTKIGCVVAMFCAVSSLTSMALAVEYPGRADPRYQNVPYIEIDELYQEYLNENVVIVDVRSELEYDTIHVDGAFHIPVGSHAFEAELKKLAETKPGKKISFY